MQLPRSFWGKPWLKEMAPLAVLHLDDPNVAVELGLAGKIGIDIRLGRLWPVQMSNPLALELAGVETGRRGAEQPRRSVEAIDLDEDGTGVVVAMPHDDGRRSGGRAAADIRFRPDFGLETHGRHVDGPRV